MRVRSNWICRRQLCQSYFKTTALLEVLCMFHLEGEVVLVALKEWKLFPNPYPHETFILQKSFLQGSVYSATPKSKYVQEYKYTVHQHVSQGREPSLGISSSPKSVLKNKSNTPYRNRDGPMSLSYESLTSVFILLLIFI